VIPSIRTPGKGGRWRSFAQAERSTLTIWKRLAAVWLLHFAAALLGIGWEPRLCQTGLLPYRLLLSPSRCMLSKADANLHP
jgi:hypothetical protein